MGCKVALRDADVGGLLGIADPIEHPRSEIAVLVFGPVNPRGRPAKVIRVDQILRGILGGIVVVVPGSSIRLYLNAFAVRSVCTAQRLCDAFAKRRMSLQHAVDIDRTCDQEQKDGQH